MDRSGEDIERLLAVVIRLPTPLAEDLKRVWTTTELLYSPQPCRREMFFESQKFPCAAPPYRLVEYTGTNFGHFVPSQVAQSRVRSAEP